MSAWPATSWTEAGQILSFAGDAMDARSYQDRFHLPPDQFFEALLAERRLADAVCFMAHALPRYESIVWAVRTLVDAQAIDRATPLVNAILRWIDNPNDDLRREIKAMADALDDYTPARLLGMAVFVSGGSISEQELPPVLAPPDASAKAVGGAILTAAYDGAKAETLLFQAATVGKTMASQGYFK